MGKMLADLPKRRGQLWELACLRWRQWPHRLPAAPPCRSELAREKPEGAACIQDASVTVGVLREQARSYKGLDLRWTIRSTICSMVVM